MESPKRGCDLGPCVRSKNAAFCVCVLKPTKYLSAVSRWTFRIFSTFFLLGGGEGEVRGARQGRGSAFY